MKRLILSVALALACSGAVAQVLTTHAGPDPLGGGGGSGCGSVWNPSDRNVAITLSTTTCTNDTATQGGASGSWRGVRGTQSYAVGTANKKVFTVTDAADSGANGDWMAGVADGSVSLTTYIGATVHALGFQSHVSGAEQDYQDGATSSACSPNLVIQASGNNVLWIAVDFNTGNVWCSINCTTWIGSGNPSTGANPAHVLSSATYLPIFAGRDDIVASGAVLNTKPALGGCSNLSGFSGWG
jgi:hypothetical protein